MTHADLDDLADLVLDPDATPDPVRRHVESCAECADRLDALLDVRRLTSGEPLVAPPERVRDRVLEQVRGPRDVPDGSRPVGLQVAEAPRDEPSVRRRVPAWAAGLAAAVTLVAGLGLGRLTSGDGTPAEPGGTVIAAADLTALDDTGAARGVARAVRSDGSITLRVQARELGAENGFHEVWLINLDGTRMVALGVLPEGDTGEFQVPRGLLDEGYRIVDISIEPNDGDPTHSGVSLARGKLA